MCLVSGINGDIHAIYNQNAILLQFQNMQSSMYPSLQFLALNSIADQGGVLQFPYNTEIHTISLWAMFVHSVASSSTISVPFHIEIEPTAYAVGAHFSPQMGIHFICQGADYSYHTHQIIYEDIFGPHDTDLDNTVQIFYDPLRFSAQFVQHCVQSLGVDSSLPATASTQYMVQVNGQYHCTYQRTIDMRTGTVKFSYITQPTYKDMYDAIMISDEDDDAY